MLSKIIMGSRDLILDTQEAQRMALFFEKIGIYSLAPSELSEDENARCEAEVEYLREKGLVETFAYSSGGIRLYNDQGEPIDIESDLKNRNDFLLDPKILLGLPPQKQEELKNSTPHLIKYISSQYLYEESPITVHGLEPTLTKTSDTYDALKISIANIPLPPENIPWEDLLAFRNEEENVKRMRKLRIWIQNQSHAGKNLNELQEELEDLLEDYKDYMKKMHKRFNTTTVSVLLSATEQAVKELLQLNPLSAVNAFFEIRAKKLDLEIGEMQAPGREVSYLAQVENFTKRK